MFAVLHIANFALHAVLRTEGNPSTSSGQARSAGSGQAHSTQPAALFANTSKKSVVLATNPAAQAAGVELGMTAPQAVARCANLTIRAPQPTAEAEARAALLAVGFTLSPLIEDTSPGVCTVDLHGADPAKIEPLARAALAELARLGLPASAGVASTPLLALYAARAAGARETKYRRQETGDRGQGTGDIRSLSTVSCPLSPVHCLLSTVLLVRDVERFLSPLPLAVADPSPELALVLRGWGLRTLGDLTALPQDEIIRRFGAEGLALWEKATGGSPRPLHPVTPEREFAARMELEDAVETLEPLLFLLRRFLDRLTLELRASQFVAVELALTLQLEDETTHARSFRLPEPTADEEILFRTLHTHLESLTTAASIVGVALRLTPARPLVRQQGLFETGLRDPHGFAETLARVSALVGSERVGTPQLEDTHRPDAVRLVAPLPVVPPAAEPAVHPPLGAPLRRFRPPLPARLEFTDGQPTYLWTDQVCGEISAKSSAFSSSGDWWERDRAWQRTEWDIALAEGGLYRLLLVGNAWFIEGEYD